MRKTLLAKHKQELTTLAELLLQKEVIFKEEIEHVLGKRGLHPASQNYIIES